MKMSTRVRILVTATAATAFLYVGTVNAQSQTPGSQQPGSQTPSSQQPSGQRGTQPSGQTPSTQSSQSATSPAQGELLEVDTSKMLVIIRTSGGQREQFTYNNSTQVNNAVVAGLATMKNAQVTVHFTGMGANRVATRIEVKPSSSASPSSTTPSTQPGAGSTPSRPSTPPSGSPAPGGSQQPQPGQPSQPR